MHINTSTMTILHTLIGVERRQAKTTCIAQSIDATVRGVKRWFLIRMNFTQNEACFVEIASLYEAVDKLARGKNKLK